MSAENYVQEQLNKLGLALRSFNIENASEQEWQQLNQLMNRQRGEEYPNDPPTLLQDTIRNLKSIPDFIVFDSWVVWRGEEVISRATYQFTKTEDNQHILEFSLYVLPEYRQQGIGKLLFQLIIEQAEIEKRRLLLTGTDSAIPAGEAFMARVGAEMAQAMDENQLIVQEVDTLLMQQWVDQAAQRAGDLELELIVGPYPEDRLEQFTEMKEVMNTAPTDDLDIEDFHFTPELLRDIDQTFKIRGIERWMMVVRDPQNDTLAVLKVLQDQPEVKYIRTGNASSNEAMLKINHEMGFRLHKTWKFWQIEAEALKKYLEQG